MRTIVLTTILRNSKIFRYPQRAETLQEDNVKKTDSYKNAVTPQYFSGTPI